MTEGTKSYLIGCHQFLMHPLWVLIAWKIKHRSWPKWWQLVCILLHDIGVCGRQYISDDDAKNGHWMDGARWSLLIVSYISKVPHSIMGLRAYRLCAGHTTESGFPVSKMYIADKYSRIIMPSWLMWPEYWFEFRKLGSATPPEWKKKLKENLKTNKPFSAHKLFLKQLNKGK